MAQIGRNSRFHPRERETLRVLEYRLRSRPAPLWARLSAWMLRPRLIRMTFQSVLSAEQRAQAHAAGFEPGYAYVAGIWPWTVELEVWSSADGTAELSVWRSGAQRGTWSIDTWYSNDAGFATGYPLRGVVPGLVLNSTANLGRDLTTHTARIRDLQPMDAVALCRATPAASTTFIHYQENCLADGSYARSCIDSMFLFALLASLSTVAISFALQLAF